MVQSTSLSFLDRLRSPDADDAWQSFVEIYAPLIQGILRQAGLSEHDAADVQQDVMSVVLRELPGFKHVGHPGAFRNWLRKVTRNRLRQFTKGKHGAAMGSVADQLEDPNSDLSKMWDQEHDRHVVDGLIAEVSLQFTDSTVEAFRRTLLQGDADEDVAAELGVTKNAVVVARCKVLRRLRELGEGLIS